jgi:hypothetical protein
VRELVERLKSLSWQQWLVVAAFLFISAFTAFNAFRAIHRAVYWSRHRDEPIHGWMSVGYVARSYRVPPRVLYEALGIQHPPHDRKPIRAIAREQGRPVHEVITDLQNAIARARQPAIQSSPPEQGRAP